MAATLSPERVFEMPGGHDWSAWRALWAEFLDNSKAALQ
jgi:enterochelin esterase-like enzyme